MNPLVIMFMLLVIAGVAFVGLTAISHLTDYNRKKAKEYLRELRDARRRLGLANSALRAIVNGAGNPVLEAQIVLDKQEQLDYKELN